MVQWEHGAMGVEHDAMGVEHGAMGVEHGTVGYISFGSMLWSCCAQ